MATLGTPYGINLWRFLASTVPGGRAVTEWLPLWDQDDYTHLALWSITVAFFLRTVWFRVWRFAPTLPALSLGVGGLLVDRLAPLFALVTLYATAESWRVGRRGRTRDFLTARPDSRSRDVIVVASLAIAFGLPPTVCLTADPAIAPDPIGAGALRLAPPGRLVLPFGWGEYAIWHFGQRLKVSIDGRRETVYSPRVIDIDAAVRNGLALGFAFLDETRPEYVWLPPAMISTHAWLQQHGYRQDIITAQSIIAVREDRPVLTAGPPVSRCFP
jgi:hypothetical protein